ncbi:MAG: DsbA family protein, partial [Fibrobacterota bacterium]
AGRVNLRMKPIHPRIGDYALLAAADMGKMTDLFAAYDRIDQRLDDEMVLRAAEYARIDQGKLVNLLEKNKDVYNAQVRRNNEEADSVGVDYTPALFINGVKYRSNKRLAWIEDYIDWCEYRRSEELVQE